MTASRLKQGGFTTVELLITLFVAAAFLAAGFQLYNIIIQDSGDTRAESRASNVAYRVMRTYSDSATNPCSATTPLSNSPSEEDGLSDVLITVNITCPYTGSGTSSLSRVEVILRYNNPQKTIRHVTYVDKSKGTTL